MQPALLIVLNKMRQEARRRLAPAGYAALPVLFSSAKLDAAGCGGTPPAADARTVHSLVGTRQQATGKRIVKTEQRVIILPSAVFAAPVRVAASMISSVSAHWHQSGHQPAPDALPHRVHHFDFFTVAIGNNIAQFERLPLIRLSAQQRNSFTRLFSRA